MDAAISIKSRKDAAALQLLPPWRRPFHHPKGQEIALQTQSILQLHLVPDLPQHLGLGPWFQ
jgi:hypothetical protein